MSKQDSSKSMSIAVRVCSALRRINDAVDDWCLRRAQRWSEQVLYGVMLGLGAILIPTVSFAGLVVMRLLAGGLCAIPRVDGLFPRMCGEAARGAELALLGVALLVAPLVTLFLGRLFVSFSSRIVVSRMSELEPADLPRKVLILGLSALPPGTSIEQALAEAQAWSGSRRHLYTGPAAAWNEARGGSAAQGRAAAAGWQQAARMVAVHLDSGKLRRIYVLPSAETRASFEGFKSYLTTLFGVPLDVRLVSAEDGSEFEDAAAVDLRRRRSYDNYVYLRDGLKRAIAVAQRDLTDIDERDICIDATAGFKLFSIAAAVVTLDRTVVLGYVVTGGGDNPEEGVVKLYDPRIEFLGALRSRLAQSAMQGN